MTAKRNALPGKIWKISRKGRSSETLSLTRRLSTVSAEGKNACTNKKPVKSGIKDIFDATSPFATRKKRIELHHQSSPKSIDQSKRKSSEACTTPRKVCRTDSPLSQVESNVLNDSLGQQQQSCRCLPNSEPIIEIESNSGSVQKETGSLVKRKLFDNSLCRNEKKICNHVSDSDEKSDGQSNVPVSNNSATNSKSAALKIRGIPAHNLDIPTHRLDSNAVNENIYAGCEKCSQQQELNDDASSDSAPPSPLGIEMRRDLNESEMSCISSARRKLFNKVLFKNHSRQLGSHVLDSDAISNSDGQSKTATANGSVCSSRNRNRTTAGRKIPKSPIHIVKSSVVSAAYSQGSGKENSTPGGIPEQLDHAKAHHEGQVLFTAATKASFDIGMVTTLISNKSSAGCDTAKEANRCSPVFKLTNKPTESQRDCRESLDTFQGHKAKPKSTSTSARNTISVDACNMQVSFTAKEKEVRSSQFNISRNSDSIKSLEQCIIAPRANDISTTAANGFISIDRRETSPHEKIKSDILSNADILSVSHSMSPTHDIRRNLFPNRKVTQKIMTDIESNLNDSSTKTVTRIPISSCPKKLTIPRQRHKCSPVFKINTQYFNAAIQTTRGPSKADIVDSVFHGPAETNSNIEGAKCCSKLLDEPRFQLPNYSSGGLKQVRNECRLPNSVSCSQRSSTSNFSDSGIQCIEEFSSQDLLSDSKIDLQNNKSRNLSTFNVNKDLGKINYSPDVLLNLHRRVRIKKGSHAALFEEMSNRFASERRLRAFEHKKNGGDHSNIKELTVAHVSKSKPMQIRAFDGSEEVMVTLDQELTKSLHCDTAQGDKVRIYPPWDEMKIADMRTYLVYTDCEVVKQTTSTPPLNNVVTAKEVSVEPYASCVEFFVSVLLGRTRDNATFNAEEILQ